ncbi:FAD-dependent monooxygenase [Legionella maioricensis]|uniref:Alkyl hydroperoxide reductase subunit F n=1 Tax=Legionella maioricensis TaxID=2896528 RepID=A0A9X2CXM7_9GAMM|nr:FAD-dependent monooxygenase [Legionella maioricensis]MCL9682606.1 FAD-dependent monooxygenase [Legionella maioricensis]MCL9686147.1 FAD-dependent monooxygenase [Legionella maioricensis]
MAQHPSVLIAGAGPSGLMMACELARYGVSYRIIDRKKGRTQTTNAAGIHTRTLEIFHHIGIVDRFLNAGQRWSAFRLYSEDELMARIPFDNIDSFYQFSLLLAQSETEKILNERLEEFKGHVEWQVELIDFKQVKGKVIATVKHADGHTETIESDWLIGCDGIHSIVREKSQISFVGDDIPHEYLVADVQLSGPIDDEADAFLGKKNMLALFPLGKEIYRIVATAEGSEVKKEFTDDEVKQIVERRCGNKFIVTSVLWSSAFWIHSKIADKMRDGSVFIGGDAAHVHSPAGAQGMNTGLQDIYNLAWKLSFVIKGKAKPELLDSYGIERLPVIEEIVNKTESITKAAFLENPLLIKLREVVTKNIIGQSDFLQDKFGMQLTQLSIHYEDSPIIHYHTDIKGHTAPKPGERAPDVVINKASERFYDYLRNTQYNLLLFTGHNINDVQLAKFLDIMQWIEQTYSDTVKVSIVSFTRMADIKNTIIDEQFALHNRYKMEDSGFYLIRPDHYIALCSYKVDKKTLNGFFNSEANLIA